MYNITSDIRLHFDQIAASFQCILDAQNSEIDKCIKEIIQNFDFERLLTQHIEYKIKDSLAQAFDKIDITENLKSIIWNRLEKDLNL